MSLVQRSITSRLRASLPPITEDEIGVPNGVAGLDGDGNIVGTMTHRIDTAANLAGVILKANELAYATDIGEWRRGDGAALGGLFLASHPITYNAVAELTSTTESGATIQHPAKANAVYRIWGAFSFSGDTDNQSNFKARMLTTSGNIASFPPLSSMYGSVLWFNSHLPGAVTPTHQAFAPAALVQFPNVNLVHPTLTLPSGAAVLDTTIATGGDDSTLQVQLNLRVAKLGTPTILAGYRIHIQRLK